MLISSIKPNHGAPAKMSQMIWLGLLHAGARYSNREVAGLTAFENGICMGNSHLLSEDNRKMMREHEYLLKYGLDKKTKLIQRFYKIFEYDLTCLAIRFYLWTRRIW